MKKIIISSYILFTISVISIIYALLFNIADWIVYGISIVFIPLSILSFGLIVMFHVSEKTEEERTREPFIGY